MSEHSKPLTGSHTRDGILLVIVCIAVLLVPYLLRQHTMHQLPRNMSLKAFDPHRPDFVCVHEVTKVPPIDPMAQEWFEQGLALTNHVWYVEDDYPGAAALWQKAAERKHWKAMMNLASLYANGGGEGKFAVERDLERAVVITEEAMKLGIPAAFDFMGTLHMEGRGVNGDADRAYAFWQLAADMGSPSAMAYLGSALDAGYDNPNAGNWANPKVGRKMLECGAAQGHAKAAFELGLSLNGDNKNFDEDYTRALIVLHNAVKFGSADAADSLSVKFYGGQPIVGNVVDNARADRYSKLGDVLRLNPDLRFPNLDKVLPLPPAKLPKWDGDPDSLVNAAKGVRVTPQQQHSSASRYPSSHRAHLPPGTMLQVPSHLARMPVLPGFTSVLAEGPGSTGLARAQIAGYWHAKLVPVTSNESPLVASLRRDLANLPPLRFEEGERMQLTMGNSNLPHEDQTHYLVEWHFVGRPVPMHVAQDWLAKAGTVRAIEAAMDTFCGGNEACPATGIWQPQVLDAEHPLRSILGVAWFSEAWKWQAFVQEGQAMPSLRQRGLPVEDAQVDWRLMQATPLGFGV